MRTYDFSPLWRSTIGFDRLFDLAETAQRGDRGQLSPLQHRTARRRPLPDLAGGGRLLARRNLDHGRAERGHHRGHKPEKAEREYLYRGISTRAFKRQFNLADYVQVKNASFDNGLLKIELVREIPEAMKPRRIAINGASPDNVHQIESKAA